MAMQTVKIKFTGRKSIDVQNIMYMLNVDCFNALDIYKALSKTAEHYYKKNITRNITRTIKIVKEV